MTYLIIVESPSKCKSIEKYAGKNYKCVASYGHINTLAKLEHINIEQGYEANYTLLPSKKKYLSAIGKLIKECGKENVILATDPDREGEAIAWHLCQHFKLDPLTTPRIMFNEITATAVQKALLSPTTINMAKVKSQQARQTVDLLVGFKTCPLLWKHIGIGDATSPVSAGRCQTPCLKLVVDHHRGEKEKKQTINYTINLVFSPPKTQNNNNIIIFPCSVCFTAPITKMELTHENAKCILEFIATNVSFQLSSSEIKKKVIQSPTPLTTSRLQQKANAFLGLSPSKTMSIAQKLYEKGYITYMRTDSQRYSEEFIQNATVYLSQLEHIKHYLKTNSELSSLRSNNQKGKSQDGHESIRPTLLKNTPDVLLTKGLKPQEVKLYKFIYDYTLQTFLTNAIYDTITITLASSNSDIPFIKTLSLKKTFTKLVYLGWKSLKALDTSSYDASTNHSETPIEQEENEKVFDTLVAYFTTPNEQKPFNAQPSKLSLTPYLKNSPTYYSEATLVKLLEKKQIGRPATYSSLVEKIQSRHFVDKMTVTPKPQKSNSYFYYTQLQSNNFEVEENEITPSPQKNKLVLQDLGERIHDFCYEFFNPLFNYDFTASLETKLDKIETGEESYENVCKECDDVLDACIGKVSFGKNGNALMTADEAATKMKIEAIKNKNKDELILGEYNGYPLIIKSGIYGYYASLGTTKISLKNMNIIDKEDFAYDAVVSFIERQQKQKEDGLLRELDNKISILKGKAGKSDYICVKHPPNKYKKNPKPTFISLKKFEEDYLTCDEQLLREYIDNSTKK